MTSRVLRTSLCAFLFASVGAAQLDNASLFGTVTDPSGASVGGAAVKIRNIDTAQSLDLTTDPNGNYFAPVLPVGGYRLTVSAPGFRTNIRDHLILRMADRVRVNVALEVGAVQDSITVSDAAPLVETGSTTLGGSVARQQIAELPVNGRDVSQLLAVIPGTNLLAGAGSMSMNGANMYRVEGAVHFLLDGADASRVDYDILDNDYGTSMGRITRAGVDATEEVRVQTSSFSAEYGNALGGVVNLTSRSGTNQFHGTLIEFFRNEQMDTRNYFNSGDKPATRLNQFGGTLGGPILHDKLFFFVGYEAVRQRTGITRTTVVPTAAYRQTLPAILQPVVNTLPLPNGPVSTAEPRLAGYTESFSNFLDEDTGSAKVDYQITSRNRVSVRYNGNSSLTNSNFGIAADQWSPAPALLQLAKATYTATVSPRLLNEVGFNVNRVHIEKWSGATQEIRDLPITSIGGGVPGIGPTGNDNRVGNTSYSWMDTLSWVKGRNQFKFGGQIIRVQENRTLLLQKTVAYNSLTDFANNSPASVGTMGYPRSGIRGTYNDFFIQDDMQLNRNVTINAGLRYQYDTPPSEAYGRIANFNPAIGQLDPVGTAVLAAPKTNLAPRFGIAWSPFGTDRTVVRSGFGLFFAVLNPYLAQTMPNNVFQWASSITRLQVPTLVGFPFPNITSFSGVTSFTALPKNYRGVYTEQWNFNIEQAVGANSMVQVGYIGNRGLHLNGTSNINRLIRGTALRPYPAFGTITYYTNGNNSSYNALQLSFRRRFHKGLTINVNYSWSHSLDDTMAANGTGSQDDTNERLDYASSDADVRHHLQFNYTYQLPSAPVLPRWLGSGWQINGITVMRAGMPVNVTCGCDSAGIGTNTGRPNYVYGVPLVPENRDIPSGQFNMSAFSVPAKGSFGNLGRNVLHGPAAYNWDFSLFKNFRIAERKTLQFRTEVYNTFNTPIFGTPSASLSAPATFGRTTGTLATVGNGAFGTNRQIQLGLRLSF